MTEHLSTLAVMVIGLAMIVWPKYGFVSLASRLRQLTRREHWEHVLKHLHHCEFTGLPATRESLAGALGISVTAVAQVVDSLESAGLVTTATGRFELTVEGRREALRVVRIHRLWETYFAHKTGLDEVLWHEEADRREHSTPTSQIETMDAQLGHPRFDPHGAPIPTAAGELPDSRGQLLTGLTVNQRARVIHVEDEPRATYQQLVAQGIAIGVQLRVLERSENRIRVDTGGEEQALAPITAGNVTVELVEEPADAESASMRLSQLPPGASGRVVRLLPSCRGMQRRRLLDLGLVTGTVVQAELKSGLGDPTAYRVRSALIALRRDEAKHVQIEQLS